MFNIRAFLLLSLLLLAFCSLLVGSLIAEKLPLESPSDESRADALIRRARELRLQEDPYWHILLHYHRTRWGGVVSDVDHASFFLSSEGRINPAREMERTLEAFFEPLKSSGVEDVERHARCAFPARFRWLTERLAVDESHFPRIPCRNFEVYHREFGARSVSYIFASYYMGAPASIFGHTFIKLNRSEATTTDLLDYSVNYAANPGDLDAFRYAFYGLFGGYDGYFSILPYHSKVREYNDMENRDIWEYVLNLNEKQNYLLELHMWELLGRSSFNYFFATENCAYQLLALIEAAAPDKRLSESYFGWVIPSETVKLLRAHGLIREVRYRPSARSVMRQRMQQLSPGEREYILTLQKNRLAPYVRPTEHNLYLYDTLLTLLQYRKERGKLLPEDEVYYRTLLRERARLPASDDRTAYEPQSTSVDEGHGPVMVRGGVGADRDGGAAVFAFRPIYHDLLNSDAGFPPFSEIEELSLRVRAPTSLPARVESLRLLHMLTLSPYDGMSFSPSFNVDMGFRSVYRRSAEYSVDGLAGPAYSDPAFVWMGRRIRDDVRLDRHPRLGPADRVAFGLVEESRYVMTGYVRALVGASIGNVYTRSLPGFAIGILAGGYAEGGAGPSRTAPQTSLLFVVGNASRRFKLQTDCYAFSARKYCEVQTGGAVSLSKNDEIRLEGVYGAEDRSIFLSFAHYL